MDTCALEREFLTKLSQEENASFERELGTYLFAMNVAHGVVDYGTEHPAVLIEVPLFCDVKLTDEIIHAKLSVAVNTIKFLQAKGAVVKHDADEANSSAKQAGSQIPLRTALQKAYETVEDARLGAEIREKAPTDSALTSYLLNRLEDTGVTLYGKRPPSTVARQIPRCEMRELTLVEGQSDLEVRADKEVKFSDVYVTQSDFRKFIEHMKRKSNEPIFDS